MEEEIPLEGPAAVVADALDEITHGILSELDLVGQNPPRRARKFLRSRPNFELGQGELYNLQVGFYPGRAGTLKRDLEALLGKPLPPLDDDEEYEDDDDEDEED